MIDNDRITMFYNAKPHIFEKAKWLRNNMTMAERILWEYLKSKKILGQRFRPQHPIDIFIADFYCHSLKFIIEVDGGIHKSYDQRKYDIGREEELKSFGLSIIRFTNEEITDNIDHVLSIIKKYCQSIMQGKSPL